MFVEIPSTEHIAQLVGELGYQLVQLGERSEVGVREHGQVFSANGDGVHKTKRKRGKGEATSLLAPLPTMKLGNNMRQAPL